MAKNKRNTNPSNYPLEIQWVADLEAQANDLLTRGSQLDFTGEDHVDIYHWIAVQGLAMRKHREMTTDQAEPEELEDPNAINKFPGWHGTKAHHEWMMNRLRTIRDEIDQYIKDTDEYMKDYEFISKPKNKQ